MRRCQCTTNKPNALAFPNFYSGKLAPFVSIEKIGRAINCPMLCECEGKFSPSLLVCYGQVQWGAHGQKKTPENCYSFSQKVQMNLANSSTNRIEKKISLIKLSSVEKERPTHARIGLELGHHCIPGKLGTMCTLGRKIP